MPIPYKAVQRKNPQKPNDPALYHVQDVAGRIIEPDELAKDVALISGMSEGDMYNVLITVFERVGYYLCNGDSVRLIRFGLTSPRLTGDHGTATPEELVRIKKEVGVNFRADQEVLDRMKRAGDTFTGDVTHVQPPTP